MGTTRRMLQGVGWGYWERSKVGFFGGEGSNCCQAEWETILSGATLHQGKEEKCLAGMEGVWSGLGISFREQWQRRMDACWIILVG